MKTTVSKKAINKFLNAYGQDGWTILPPETLIEYGFPFEWVNPLVRRHDSGEGKYAITDLKTGKLVKSLTGVYVLHVLSKLARELEAECEPKLGRGSQARAYTEGIKKMLDS